MSILKAEDSKKWISLFLVLVGALVASVVIAFLTQCSEWFNLESKIDHFPIMTQMIGILAGVGTFFGGFRHQKASTYLNEVYKEVMQVVWAKKEATLGLTFIVLIAVAVAGAVLVGFDIGFRKLLALFY